MAPQQSLCIHDATHADLEALQRIGCDTYREHFSGIWTRAGMQRFLSDDFSSENLASSLAATNQHLWLLAKDGAGNTQGFAKLNWNSRMPLHNAVGAELQKIYLLKSATGKGYGTQLLRAICERAAARQQQRLWLDVLKSNRAAQAFYSRFGFHACGEIPFSTDLFEIGMQVMTYDLTSRPQAHPTTCS
ncbi:GNAT family N-acetyltransferase [Pseudomonas anguilliseptica]|uniref:Ribosomal protein S18 acetylase RimI n=1 Tax=Pseudomonas anguilliseptica TaxID=53406 RepID=A0A1H4Z476_PSEAG|nr:GNAT family N-acetyltransferase [Pseudomonas anguilliseptica]SED24130.1 Ribosomal protein S18 acetylase RimI [Pseudomonas anguilliseptica]